VSSPKKSSALAARAARWAAEAAEKRAKERARKKAAEKAAAKRAPRRDGLAQARRSLCLVAELTLAGAA
jgi:hypothetical protein